MQRIKFTRPGNYFVQLQWSSSRSTDVHCWVMTSFQISMKLCGHHTLFLSVTYRKKRSVRGAVTVPRPGVRSAASRARATAWCPRGARGRRAPRPASHPATPDQRGPDGDISSPTPRRVSVVYQWDAQTRAKSCSLRVVHVNLVGAMFLCSLQYIPSLQKPQKIFLEIPPFLSRK